MSGNGRRPKRRLGVGFIGSGFNARFHLQGWRTVRDADVLGIWSPNQKNAASAAKLARDLEVGDAKPYTSIGDMVADPEIDAIWLTGPNHARIENVEEKKKVYAAVGAVDLTAFRTAMNKTSTELGYRAYFDFDSSGVIDVLDYNQFRARVGRRI